MSKSSTTYVCRNCGNVTFRKMGKCLSCNEFGTLEEQASKEEAVAAAQAGLKSSTAIIPIKKAQGLDALKGTQTPRIPTGIGEFDRVLGGGFVPSEVVLFAGHPGAGKSTLSLAIAEKMAKLGHTVLYSSGEESEHQIALRAERMGISDPRIRITNETNLETLLGHIDGENPTFVVVDSLQTLASSAIPGGMGSISQSREAAHTLTRLAKKENVIMVLINQIIKSGEFAGSEAVQHIVDCSIILESDGDTPLKFLKATKNRFGDTTEVGVFQHSTQGLEEVSDPAGIFLEEHSDVAASGTARSFLTEGIRQIPIEIQALVSNSTLPTPRKQFNGINYNRGQIVCAILDKHCKGGLFGKDVFIATLSGVKVNDPQADLAMAAALLSSSKEKALPSDTLFVGELSLTGQVRGNFMIEQKLKEASRLGFTQVVLPKWSKTVTPPRGLKLTTITHVKDLLKFFS